MADRRRGPVHQGHKLTAELWGWTNGPVSLDTLERDAFEDESIDAARPVEIRQEPDSIDNKAGGGLRLLPQTRSIATMDAAARIRYAREILSTVYPKERVRKLLKDLAAETTRETTKRAKETLRPDWIKARNGGVTVPEFIKKAFAAEIADGSMHKGLFSRYENLRRDFYGYQRSNKLPDWLKAVPTQEEWEKRQIAEGKATPVQTVSRAELRAFWRGQKRVASARRRGIPVVEPA